jgi:chromate transporter
MDHLLPPQECIYPLFLVDAPAEMELSMNERALIRMRSQVRPSLALLFVSFLRLGATSFGGPAMIAYIRRLAVEEMGWLSDAAFRDGVALCQTVPGATAMQVAAYVGLRARSIPGAAACYIGFGLPAFCIMMVLSSLYLQARSLPAAVSAFSGLQVIIVAIVGVAAISFGRSYLKLWRDAGVAAGAAIMFISGTSPLAVILLAAIAGLVIYRSPPIPPSMEVQMEVPSTTGALISILLGTSAGFVLLFLLYRELFDLAFLMFRIDLFAFGGGFASLPFMLHEFVEVRSWMDGQTFLDGIALGQITPGPIVITATFIGYMLYGPPGGIIATVSVFLPSFLIVIGTVPYYDRLRASPGFNRAISGIFCSFVGLLASVAIHFAGNVTWDAPRIMLATGAFFALQRRVEILWVVLAGAAASAILL